MGGRDHLAGGNFGRRVPDDVPVSTGFGRFRPNLIRHRFRSHFGSSQTVSPTSYERCIASLSAMAHPMAARLRMLERDLREQHSSAGFLAYILEAATAAHSNLDDILGFHAHSLTAAIRLAYRLGLVGQPLRNRLWRVADSANALRHTTPLGVQAVLEELRAVNAGSLPTAARDADEIDDDRDNVNSQAQHTQYFDISECVTVGSQTMLSVPASFDIVPILPHRVSGHPAAGSPLGALTVASNHGHDASSPPADHH